MADTDTDSASFWLPSEFLTDDDFLIDFKTTSKPPSPGGGDGGRREFTAPTRNADLNRHISLTNSGGYYDLFASPPTLNSPGESVTTSSAETEEENINDRNELIAELTRHLARSSSLEDHRSAAPKQLHPHQKSWGVLATSPQSTLSGFTTWSNRSTSAQEITPHLRRCSHPFPAYKDDTLELIYAAAAGEVARMKMRAQAQHHHMLKQQQQAHLQQQNNRGLLFGPHCNPSSPDPYPAVGHAPGCFHHSRQTPIQQLKNQHHVKEEGWLCQHPQLNCRGNGCGVGLIQNGRCTGGLGGFAWPTPRAQSHNHQHSNHYCPHPRRQPPNGEYVVRSGPAVNGAAFVGVPSPSAPVVAKKKSVGTGVFLPRRFVSENAGCEPRRKQQGCSPVMVPAKMSQSLNMKLEEVNINNGGPHFQSHPSLVSSNHDVVLLARRNAFTPQQKTSPKPEKPVLQQHEVLPQDWTY